MVKKNVAAKVKRNLFKAIVLHICSMQKLNLPDYAFRIQTNEGVESIYDIIRNKYIVLTAEEWVRQHIIRYLIEDLGYPKGLIKVESGVSYNSRIKRSDIVVFNNMGEPSILVECKSPDISINQSTLEQAAMYNHTLKAEIIVLTNGITHFTFSIDSTGKLVNRNEIPSYKGK